MEWEEYARNMKSLRSKYDWWMQRELAEESRLIGGNETMPVNNIKLEIGCGHNKAEGWIGIDKQALPGVDLPWDLENTPWPLPDECCYYIRGIHVMEHICPRKQIAVMNELWRVAQVDGILELNVPLAGSEVDFWNPDHCAHFTARSWELFDPGFPRYLCYKPKPWRILDGYPKVSGEGTIGVMLKKYQERFTDEKP